MRQTRMQEDSRDDACEAEDDGAAEERGWRRRDLNLPAARSLDDPPSALGVDTMGNLHVSLPWPLPQLVSSLRLEAWRFLSPWVP